MKPTPLRPLSPARRLFTVPACPRLRKLARWNERVKDAFRAAVCLAGLLVITHFYKLGLVPV